MKEKLIKIADYCGGNGAEIAEQFLAVLRCDTCRYWVHEGECIKLTDSPAVSINDAYSDGVQTDPDFFCGLWEPKA